MFQKINQNKMKKYNKINNYCLIMQDILLHNKKTFLVLILKNFNLTLKKKNFLSHKNYNKM